MGRSNDSIGIIRGSLISLGLCSLLTDGQIITAALAQESQQAQTVLEEVVVTARRREESLQDVPSSITALTPNFMREQNLTHTSELDEFVPNLSIEQGQRGTNASYFIRGIGGNSADPTIAPGVGVYINGITTVRLTAPGLPPSV